MPATSESAKLKDDLSVLTKKKEVMEQLIAAYREQGMIGEELIDKEGFPRNDVDLVAVRTARNKHVCLQNDHKGRRSICIDMNLEAHRSLLSLTVKSSYA